MKKLRPILFSTPMVQAILEGRKTQTRRAKGLEKIKDYYFQSLVHHTTGKFTFVKNDNYNPTADDVVEIKCPYGKVGDVLWVRESHCPKYFDNGAPGYKADWNKTAAEYVQEPKWKPSIHMPFDAARIFLEITDVRVEKLQYISDQDAKDEGVDFTKYVNATARYHFMELWQSINGTDSWNANPWVWVVEFKQITKVEAIK